MATKDFGFWEISDVNNCFSDFFKVFYLFLKKLAKTRSQKIIKVSATSQHQFTFLKFFLFDSKTYCNEKIERFRPKAVKF